MDRCLSENEILEAMDTWPKYGCMPDGRFIRLTKENEQDYVPFVHYDDMVKVVKGTPSLDVALLVHAHWRYTHFSKSFGLFVGACSSCGSPNIMDAYCGNCGAKMDEEVPDNA